MVGIGQRPSIGGPARGDVHLVDFPDVGGHVMLGPHPAVIVRTDRMAKSNTVIVVPMTSAPRSAPERPRYLVPVGGRDAGLTRDGFVKCDQVMTFPTVMLGPRLGRLNLEAIDRVDDALRFVLGL